MITYQYIILLCWAAFLVIWMISAFNIKRDVRGGFAGWWSQYWFLRVIAAILIVFVVTRITTGTAHYVNLDEVFQRIIFRSSVPMGWAAAILSVIGVSFAIWARFHLGKNWSPMPSVKEQHELVTTGPYKYVRHPIYAGMILMAFGMALTGSIWGILVFIFACVVFISRISKEEKIMLKLFPNEYPAYQLRTKKLIPFVW